MKQPLPFMSISCFDTKNGAHREYMAFFLFLNRVLAGLGVGFTSPECLFFGICVRRILKSSGKNPSSRCEDERGAAVRRCKKPADRQMEWCNYTQEGRGETSLKLLVWADNQRLFQKITLLPPICAPFKGLCVHNVISFSAVPFCPNLYCARLYVHSNFAQLHRAPLLLFLLFLLLLLLLLLHCLKTSVIAIRFQLCLVLPFALLCFVQESQYSINGLEEYRCNCWFSFLLPRGLVEKRKVDLTLSFSVKHHLLSHPSPAFRSIGCV